MKFKWVCPRCGSYEVALPKRETQWAIIELISIIMNEHRIISSRLAMHYSMCITPINDIAIYYQDPFLRG